MDLKSKKIICIIIARGGSKGIKNKNLKIINGKPLIYWTIKSAKKCNFLNSIWVSSDSDTILKYAKKNKLKTIKRPKRYSLDKSSSEDAWKHAIKTLQKSKLDFDYVLAPQVTSPLRDNNDFNKGIILFFKQQLDSMFSCTKVKDFFIWKKINNRYHANYNYLKRQRRQKIKDQYLENGSFYFFKKKGFLRNNNRLFGKIGKYEMTKLNSFQIDDFEDIKIVNLLFKKKN